MSATRLEPNSTEVIAALERQRTLDHYRRWGYLEANLDPLGQYLAPSPIEDERFTGPGAEQARSYYCGTVGVEFMHIPSAERRLWLEQRLECAPPKTTPEAQRQILDDLTKADIFEQVIQSRYLGTKRFSLEGVTVLIPFLEEMLNRAAELGAVKSIMGMSHRGRLNVMVNTFRKSASDIFAKFEDVDPRSILGSGDVKYHQGATAELTMRNGATMALHLASNPSHLEAVDPIVAGRAKAKQMRLARTTDLNPYHAVLPITIHGDAAFAGQGIWAETLNLAYVDGYNLGGSIRIIVNNLIGFTAEPEESNSSRYASDMAKRLPVPIFHINAEDPESAMRMARLAIEYRYTFGSDVVIDLVGYRRHGHSEIDDPTITQPLRYARIKQHLPLFESYAKKIGVENEARIKELQAEFGEAQKIARKLEKLPVIARLPEYWSAYQGGPYRREAEVDTGLEREEIALLAEGITRYPESFHVHPKILKLLEQRLEMGQGKRPFDYGMAEAVAIGSLLKQGTPVRLSGQDSQRGTFNQRHSVLIDIEDEQRWVPLNHLAEEQASLNVYNSTLSEAGVLGFEYGYSRDYPESLVMWEAQFGDFANGAQIVIDQFISSAEDKWGLLSGLVLLLPHGYEGQGPEHSSARIERYLQLSARDNMQVCQPSTAAQYFHLLRRQAMRSWRKPLVLFMPKSMLRHPDAISPMEAFMAQRFEPVVAETEIKNAERLLICTGKIGHELRVERNRRNDTKTGILFLDQLYPWPEAELKAAIEAHPQAHEVVWVQEEPENMGALSFVMPRLRALARGRQVLSVKRSAAASPATGSSKAHELEQKTLIDLALTHALTEKLVR